MWSLFYLAKARKTIELPKIDEVQNTIDIISESVLVDDRKVVIDAKEKSSFSPDIKHQKKHSPLIVAFLCAGIHHRSCDFETTMKSVKG